MYVELSIIINFQPFLCSMCLLYIYCIYTLNLWSVKFLQILIQCSVSHRNHVVCGFAAQEIFLLLSMLKTVVLLNIINNAARKVNYSILLLSQRLSGIKICLQPGLECGYC